MTTDEKLGKEIEALDREAREALDRLADKRAELQRQLRDTDLAAERHAEREQERREKEEREAREREERRRREELAGMGKARLVLEQRAEQEAASLFSTLEELTSLDGVHWRALSAAGGTPPTQMLRRELVAWLGGRLGEFSPASDYRSTHPSPGPDLPTRDPLTPGATEREGGNGGG